MRRTTVSALLLIAGLAAGCSRHEEAPTGPVTVVEAAPSPDVFTVENPAVFKTTPVVAKELPTTFSTTASVSPDITKTVHVTSLGSGRATDLRVRLGDYVHKGQLLMSVTSADLGSAAADYDKAVADEGLAKRALDRTKLLYEHGAAAQKDVEAAQDAEDKAKVDVENAAQRVRLLGGTVGRLSPVIELRAPISGTIVEQNVTGSEGIKSIDNTPNLFTIADLSDVWILCDVYENQLGEIREGDIADVKLVAFPKDTFQGQVSNIARVLDPATRTAAVRVVLQNPKGLFRPGMFATVTFRSRTLHPALVVPDAAVLRLEDKSWVFVQEGDKRFRKVQVETGPASNAGFQAVRSGLKGGEQVVVNALEFSSAVAGGQS